MKIIKTHKKINIPTNVLEICAKLEENGEQAWVVGGCIRDTLLGITPNDWDITTSAMPEKVIHLFGNSFGNGIDYGIPFIQYKGETYEIAQFRKDLEQDGRHCKTTFALCIEEDLIRRDFTINAIAYRPNTQELAYPETALDDLNNKCLCCVGDAKRRYQEDALRVLRLYRFASTLTFNIEEESRNAAKWAAKENLLSILSSERIKKEMTKLLLGDNVKEILIQMRDDGILEKIIPELIETFYYDQENPNHNLGLFEHLISTISLVEKKSDIRWAAFLHDIGKPIVATRDALTNELHFLNHATISGDIAEPLLRRLTFSNDEITHILNLIKYHDFTPNTKSAIRRMCGRDGVDFVYEVISIRMADILSQSSYNREEKIENVNFVKQTLEEIIENNQKFSLKDLAINGRDLIAIGVKPGPKMGEILENVLNEVLEDPNLNQYETLIEIAKKYM